MQRQNPKGKKWISRQKLPRKSIQMPNLRLTVCPWASAIRVYLSLFKWLSLAHCETHLCASFSLVTVSTHQALCQIRNYTLILSHYTTSYDFSGLASTNAQHNKRLMQKYLINLWTHYLVPHFYSIYFWIILRSLTTTCIIYLEHSDSIHFKSYCLEYLIILLIERNKQNEIQFNELSGNPRPIN